MKNFKNKTVIITGGSEGIGAATAKRFYDLGANIILIARREGVLQSFAHSFLDQSRVKYYAMSVLDYAKFSVLLEETKKQFGSIDILINNAGANHRGAVMNVSSEQLQNVIDINLTAPIILTRLILPYFEAQKEGLIVNVASLAGRTPVDGAAIYSASKFGIRAFTKAMNADYEGTDKNIRACVVSPGPILTNFVLKDLDNVADMVFSQPLSTSEDIADMIEACARDYKVERLSGGFKTGILTNFGYIFPAFKKLFTPLFIAKGRKVKDKLRAKRDAGLLKLNE
jgi:short-subunit dehydrogenase